MKVLILIQNKIGGTDVLLTRVYERLLQSGYTAKIFDKSKIYSEKFDLIILPTSEMHQIISLKRNKIRYEKFLVWSMGSRAFHGAFTNQFSSTFIGKFCSHFFNLPINFFLSTLLKNGNIVFTDEVGLDSDLVDKSLLLKNFEDAILPIPINITFPYKLRIFSNPPRNFLWIGRIESDFKILPLIKTIRDLSKAVHSGDVAESPTYTIIGDGSSYEFLLNEITHHKNIKFNLIRHLPIEKLHEKLSDDFDLLFAMGTSALEGAVNSIPTLIVQPFTRESEEPSHPYRWIQQTNGYSLGEFQWVTSIFEQPKYSFNEIIKGVDLVNAGYEGYLFAKKFDINIVIKRMTSKKINYRFDVNTTIFLYLLRVLKFFKIIIKDVINECKSKNS